MTKTKGCDVHCVCVLDSCKQQSAVHKVLSDRLCKKWKSESMELKEVSSEAELIIEIRTPCLRRIKTGCQAKK